MQTILGLVAGGIGVALVIAPHGYRGLGDVVFKPLAKKQVPHWDMALAWRHDHEQSPAVQSFLSVSEQVIRQLQQSRVEQSRAEWSSEARRMSFHTSPCIYYLIMVGLPLAKEAHNG